MTVQISRQQGPEARQLAQIAYEDKKGHIGIGVPGNRNRDSASIRKDTRLRGVSESAASAGDEGAGTLLGMYRLLGEYLFSSSRWEEFQSIIR